MKTAQLRVEDGLCRVEGELTFGTVKGILVESEPLFAGGSGELIVDLGGVTRADSAGLALLLEWIRRARRAGRAIQFRDMPEQMLAIARTSDLEPLLPIRT